MTVAEINALLYSPNHPRGLLERALRIEALSPGWRGSFEALLRSSTSGNAGLIPEAAAHPAAPGFHRLAVTSIDRESADVLSVTMQAPDGRAAAGGSGRASTSSSGSSQTRGRPPIFRSYSLSGPLSAERYRISVKIEPNGVAGTWLRDHLQVGDTLDVSSPRGSFILQIGERPVVLRQRGNRGDTGAGNAPRARRDPVQPAGLMVPRGSRSRTPSFCRRSPSPDAGPPARPKLCLLQQTGLVGQVGRGFRRRRSLVATGVRRGPYPARSGRLPLWTNCLYGGYEGGTCGLWRPAGTDSHRDLQWQRGDESWCGPGSDGTPIRMHPRATPTPGRWYRSRAAASPPIGTRRPTRAFWNWPKRATFRSVGRAGPVCVIAVRAVWFRERSPTDQSRSTNPLKATFSFAAHGRFAMSSSIL